MTKNVITSVDKKKKHREGHYVMMCHPSYAESKYTCMRRSHNHLWDRFARCSINQMPSESQGLKTKQKVETLITFFVCLGLKRAEKINGGYKHFFLQKYFFFQKRVHIFFSKAIFSL